MCLITPARTRNSQVSAWQLLPVSASPPGGSASGLAGAGGIVSLRALTGLKVGVRAAGYVLEHQPVSQLGQVRVTRAAVAMPSQTIVLASSGPRDINS
jgi:hypothetical protein